MATAPGGFATGIYRSGPFVDVHVDGSATVDLPGASHIAADDVDRYGYQSSYDYREILRLGVASLDATVRSSGGTTFAELTPGDQDFVLMTLASGEASDFGEPGASTFFSTVHAHVIEGMFCDPVYGGNRGLQAWKLVGYPGAQRAYTPTYLHGDEPEFAPQSIAEMIAFNPGRNDLGGEQVVSGADGGHEHGDHPNP
jgi:gluconate 2-dehydrogenase gamma chain